MNRQGPLFFIMCFGLYISVRAKTSTAAIVTVLGGFMLWYFVSYIALIIPMMFSMIIFPFAGPGVMMLGRPIMNTVFAFFFLWRAKKTLRYYAYAK